MAEDIKESLPLPPPRTRRTTGWSEEPSKISKSRNSSSVAESDKVKSAERLTIIDSDDDIPVIPDLEEMHDDYADNAISNTSLAVIQMTKYKETDTDFLKNSAFTGYEDGMLRLLTKGMQLEFEVKEDDAPLTWQQLFAKISSETTS